MSLRALVARLAAREADWQGVHFVAPVLAPGRAAVRLQGLTRLVQIEPAGFSGVGVFEFCAPGRAVFRRAASLRERETCLGGAATRRLCLLAPLGDGRPAWWALAADESRPVLVALVESGQPFGLIRAVCRGERGCGSGGVAWSWCLGPARDAIPGLADRLAEALRDAVSPAQLRIRGLDPLARQAYAWLWRARFPDEPSVRQAPPPDDRQRLTRALRRAGGELRHFASDRRQADLWEVQWSDSRGDVHRSLVRPDDLTVVSSGICLSGQDEEFDLTSLVGVVEGGEL